MVGGLVWELKIDPKKLREEIKNRHRKKKERQKNFQRWLHEYNEKNIQIKQIITHLCNDTFSMIRTNGFTISNEKILRDEIATFIYKEASDHA